MSIQRAANAQSRLFRGFLVELSNATYYCGLVGNITSLLAKAHVLFKGFFVLPLFSFPSGFTSDEKAIVINFLMGREIKT